MYRRLMVALGAGCVLLLSGACGAEQGGEGTSGQQAPAEREADRLREDVERLKDEAAAARKEARTGRRQAREDAAAEETAQEEAPDATSGEGVPVPDVVGTDHQLAQDTMQEAGFFDLREEDATGGDRLLLFDRNWVVVEQDPAAGELAGPDATITLYAKKDGE